MDSQQFVCFIIEGGYFFADVHWVSQRLSADGIQSKFAQGRRGLLQIAEGEMLTEKEMQI